MTDRYIRDGKVAVLVSCDFGAGWSTWADADYHPAIVFDPWIVDLLLSERYSEDEREARLIAYCRIKYPKMYDKPRTLEVQWVPQGAVFRIAEYDGSETIEFKDSIEWLTA